MTRALLLTAAAAALAAASPAAARPMKWMDAAGAGLPAGAQMAVVKGDPSKAGDFTVRLKFPADFTVPPHHHPGDETVRVVSGGPLHYGMASKIRRENRPAAVSGENHIALAQRRDARIGLGDDATIV